ncbi:MAG: DUF1850 domain-containing protein [Paracoccus sp.]|nr:DUF1850 domain-containing protein [Paracoccus sp. (in: a-proteobacteria)]
MSACLMAGAMAIALGPGNGFSLSWTHSVEKTEWREDWRVTDAGLVPVRAAVKGSGAGMEPGPDARLQDGWLVWQPKAPPVRELALAASGATGAGWRICGVDCVTLGTDAGAPLLLRPCP